MPSTTKYDIFISYRSTHRPWVEILAHNLVAQGYKVFLDAWELYGGQNFTRKIYSALNSSSCALLIATPESADSGWVQQEYEYMLNLSKNREDFFWVPVTFGEFPDFPFLNTVHAVDFSDSKPATYRRAFQQLLCALKQQPPGANPSFSGDLQLPEAEQPIRELVTQERAFVDTVFGYLEASTPIMILAQADTSTQHYAYALRESAEQRYGVENVLHIYPPASTRADSAACFGRLAKQCGFDESIGESWEWSDALRTRLNQSDELLLLVTGFENGPDNARSELAGELRGLLEEHSGSLKLVLIGGERLAAMKYQHGNMSLLNRLEELRLPQTHLRDLRDIYLQRYPHLKLDDESLQAMLDFTGHHPRLLEACLQAVQRGSGDWQTELINSALPSQLYTQFRNDADRLPLCSLLRRDQLGRYDAWPQDDLLRRLYWNNLITNRDGQFVWRCAFIRDTGRELLGC